MAEPLPASDPAATGGNQADEKVVAHGEHGAHLHDDDHGLYPSTNQSVASTYGDTDPERGGLAKDELPAIDEKQQEPLDANLVDWDGPDDPEKPTNWPSSRKYGIIAIISSITFLTYVHVTTPGLCTSLSLHRPLASSMFAPGIPQVMAEFKSNNVELASFAVSIYILGFAFGPTVLAPLSELYGRVPVYHVCNTLFVIFTVACAVSSNLNMLLAWRFFEGLFGSAPLTNGGGTIADMIVQEKRGGMMAIFTMGPLMGPVIGPVAGGFLAEAKGWRWVFWLIAIVVSEIRWRLKYYR